MGEITYLFADQVLLLELGSFVVVGEIEFGLISLGFAESFGGDSTEKLIGFEEVIVIGEESDIFTEVLLIFCEGTFSLGLFDGAGFLVEEGGGCVLVVAGVVVLLEGGGKDYFLAVFVVAG